MRKGMKRALLLGSIPFVTLVFCLPFVNRLRPWILGLPFLLFWILFWVLMTPLALYLADRALRKSGESPDEEQP